MDYRNFNYLDFLLDEAFQEWVLTPTPESNEFWQNWVRNHPEKEAAILKARAIMLNLDFEGSKIDEFNKEEILHNIQAIIKAGELTEELNISKEGDELHTDDEVGEKLIYSLPSKRTYRIKPWHKIGIAASICLLLIIGIWQIEFQHQEVIYTTQFGETKDITLPDGSEVVLNANSTLSYSQDLQNHAAREVRLRGEAFFSVVHTEDDEKFIVHSDGVAVEVLGTEFNVNNRRGKTQVVLKSGKVKLNLLENQRYNQDETSLDMEPGDLIEVSENDQKITKRIVNPEKYDLWTQDVLVFDSVPLSEVFEMIQDNYGLNVTVVDEGIENKILEAEISSRDLDLIIEILSKSFMLNIEKNGNELIVKKQ
ncbi:FecR domain-containing protein [Catalinimonas sp. 4WD22]|uniref:FecR family protein n=1 Tax=Catalinimonas locisalis TaxID=3133978 RepID=UPI003101522D